MAGTVLPQALIRTKRDGGELSPEELRSFVQGVTDGSIPDYQVAAMLMAIFFRGLSTSELATWADAMLHSGDVLDLSHIEQRKVDKHSTGGVGDKISLPLAAAVGACGVAVPMVSGRGLGHTGGTLDKLESIPGFSVRLSTEEFIDGVREIGVSLIGQTERIAPADRRLYALRDVTATVESIPLIASSIMSKKLAEGIDGLVLDCKVGHGAFMKDLRSARELAQNLRIIGEAAGKEIRVVLSAMDDPIGKYVGNALEVLESVQTMKGEGPRDTRELTVVLGAEMLCIGGVADSPEQGQEKISRALDDGSALEKFKEVVARQGGDPSALEDFHNKMPQAKERSEILAPHDGTVSAILARDIGMSALFLGAGRRTKEDDVDPAVGVELCVERGDTVKKGDPLAILHHNGRGLEQSSKKAIAAFQFDDGAKRLPSRIIEVLR